MGSETIRQLKKVQKIHYPYYENSCSGQPGTFSSAALWISRRRDVSAEEPAGAEGVVASNHPVAATGADRTSERVAAFGIVGACAIATVSGVVIDGGPEAVGLMGEWGGRTYCEGP